MIVLDTSVLSLVFRRQTTLGDESAVAVVLRRMIVDDWPLAMPGIVLQELLSGVRTGKQFRSLLAHVEGFSVILADERHHIQAADITNTCRKAGVSCSTVDALIAALTIAEGDRLFTTDRDFQKIALHCGLQLFSVDDVAT